MCWVMPPASPAITLVLRIVVEQRRLAVVDVTHHGHHRRTVHQELLRPSARLLDLFGLGAVLGDELDVVAELVGDREDRVLVEPLVDRRHQAEAACRW